MSAPSPMEIYVQNPQDADIADQNGVVTVDSTPSPIIPQDKVLVSGMYDAPFHHQFLIVLNFDLELVPIWGFADGLVVNLCSLKENFQMIVGFS